jgi:prepilin signal peptidase PulO-like enzyme (type II secretory pathway)
MSDIATYTFLPWLRQGLANQISGASGQRATVPVDLVLTGRKLDGSTETKPPIHRDIEIYGPGDVTGLDPRAIIKTEPGNFITNFEPNYLAYIDFYDEDLPWRYSPVVPSGHRLLPWMMLIVVKDTEFKDGRNVKDRPLPYIVPAGTLKLPPPEQLWAWAHVHINKNLIGTSFNSTDAAAIQTQVSQALNADADTGYSRILCPRRLEANTSYHAFLVPSFESGRLAGLGQDPAGAAASDTPAWTDAAIPTEIPFYHRWYFRTGSIGDFEYLVRLLKPQPIDSRVGQRDMDVQKPGANIQGIVDAPAAPPEQALGGILKLGGVLRIPDAFYTPEERAEVIKYRNWATLNGAQPYPHPFQRDAAAFINLTAEYEDKSAAQANADSNITEVETAADPDTEYDIRQNPDPLITAPLYGRWHSLTKRLLKDTDGADLVPNDNWVHELNLDPRWRSAAGFGTAVVQDNQEDYMAAAWDQVGEVLEANKKIKYAQVAKVASGYWYSTYLKPVTETKPDTWLAVSAPLHARVMTAAITQNEGVAVTRRMTVRSNIARSRVPLAALSTGMRKQLRPRGPLVKRLPFTDRITPGNIVSRINSGEVSAAPPRVSPPSLNGHAEAAEQVKPTDVPPWLADLLTRHAWLRWLPLILAVIILLLLLLIAPIAVALAIGAIVIAGAVYLYRVLRNWQRRLSGGESIVPENQKPQTIEAWPQSSNFKVSTDGIIVRPTFGGSDSQEAVRFKTALKDVYTLVQESLAASVVVVKPSLDLAATGRRVFEALNPDITIPKWTWAGVTIPPRIKDQLDEEFVEAMAYPEIDLPMYKPLVDRSSELFLPNIQHIAQNSISLLETNQPFIEAYMVGLNHEFARELLWREYPTDQRGSYFRQFWEARAYHDDSHLDPEALKEKLRDIPPIHLWSKFSKLGDHDHREVPGENEEEVVLVIRGELLKRYPNAVIYAQRAAWKNADGDVILDSAASNTIDPTKERDLRPLSDTEQANPPRSILKTPLYEAKVDPDIHFFGFDLTVCEAQGGTGKADVPVEQLCADEGVTWDDPGWFFVIKERPGEPRFGLDIGDEPSLDEQLRVEVWNDLRWQDVTPAVAEGSYLQITAQTQTITANQPLEPEDAEKTEQRQEDGNITWSKDMSAAELAYILYQVPVLVAVHAAEMLPQD